jgi:TolB protein
MSNIIQITHIRALFLLLLLLALIACSEPVQRSTEPELVSIARQEEAALEAEPVQGETLPGRLLFVRRGTVWLWEEREGHPLLGEGDAWQPAWSPNGTQIAYVERGESYSDVLLADAQGAFVDRLTANRSSAVPHSHERIYSSQWAFYPTWSSDGRRIAMAAQYGPPTGSPAFEYTLDLYTLPAAGGRQQQLYADDNVHVGPMVYDDSGSMLVYTHIGINGESEPQLYRLALSSGVSTPLPGAPVPAYDPAFSPDGRWLAFAARDEARTDIWVLPANATEGSNPIPRRLTDQGTARAPIFSPDGQLLAFLAIPPGKSGFELWVANVEVGDNGTLRTTRPRQITRDMRLDADSGLSWAP